MVTLLDVHSLSDEVLDYLHCDDCLYLLVSLYLLSLLLLLLGDENLMLKKL